MKAGRISLVINSNGRPGLLAEALGACGGLKAADFEVIVVQGPDRRGYRAALLPHGGRIKLLNCPEANLARSRNIGLQAAAGDYVAFLDDDAAPHPGWLCELRLAFDDPDVAAAGGFTVGPGGLQFQTRKIVCDRRGRAHMMADWFDERDLCRPGSALYPAPMGTNVMFRREALMALGGFDETYAYYLEETDVCLRLLDQGWHIRFRPGALVWHQFAASHLRSADNVPRSLWPLAHSKGYFIGRWGQSSGEERATADHLASQELRAFEVDKLGLVKALAGKGRLSASEAARLDNEVRAGLQTGLALGQSRRGEDAAPGVKTAVPAGQRLRRPPPFRPFGKRGSGVMTIGLVCRHYLDAEDSGIPRWTRLLAEGLAQRGHQLHVFCAAREAPAIMRQNGCWVHELAIPEPSVRARRGKLRLPAAMAGFSCAVRERVESLRSFGLQLVSFPIWDLEGADLLGDDDLAVGISLHTTFSLAAPWHDDWMMDDDWRQRVVEPMIAAEKLALAQADFILANSRAIKKDLGLMRNSKVHLVPHGMARAAAAQPKRAAALAGKKLLPLLFAGRAESRKGLDIALESFIAARGQRAKLALTVAGCSRADALAHIPPALRDAVEAAERQGCLTFAGVLDREELERTMAAAAVVVMPSRYESFGLVAIEAMAQGTPVFACAAGGLAEVVRHGKNGRLFALARAIPELTRLLVEADTHRAELARLSSGALRHVTRHASLARMVTETEAVFRAAIAGKRRAAVKEQRRASHGR